MLSTGECLQDDVVGAGPHEVHVDTHLLEMVAECGQRPLETYIVLLFIFILNELFVFLID